MHVHVPKYCVLTETPGDYLPGDVEAFNADMWLINDNL